MPKRLNPVTRDNLRFRMRLCPFTCRYDTYRAIMEYNNADIVGQIRSPLPSSSRRPPKPLQQVRSDQATRPAHLCRRKSIAPLIGPAHTKMADLDRLLDRRHPEGCLGNLVELQQPFEIRRFVRHELVVSRNQDIVAVGFYNLEPSIDPIHHARKEPLGSMET